MMKLNFKIHPTTYVFLIIAMLSGYFKYIILAFSIIIIHEFGHIFFAKLFKRKVVSLQIYPIGGLTKIDCEVSTNIYEDLLIAQGGVLIQIILALISHILLKFCLISSDTFITFNYYNKLLIMFNLFPICPLDGYKILELILSILFPYKSALLITTIQSSLLLLIILINPTLIDKNALMFFFLVYFTIKNIKNRKYLLNRFYLERIEKKFNYKLIKIKHIKNMYKNKRHIICGLEENEYIKRCKYKNFYY